MDLQRGTEASLMRRAPGGGAAGNRSGVGLARTLGWFSLALGATELLAPRTLARSLGSDRAAVLPLLGAREIASGLGILSGRATGGWLWSRVAGDLVDFAVIGTTARRVGRSKGAVAALVGVTALDFYSARRMRQRRHGEIADAVCMAQSIAINRSPAECYRFWRDFENLPRFMRHLESVRVTNLNQSHWVVHGPAGAKLEWDAEITEEVPDERIAWRSKPGADVDSEGSVRFEKGPRGRGTAVRVALAYRPPAGKRGAMVAKVFGQAPEQQIREELRRFKQIMEAGEVATTEGQPSGRRGPVSRWLSKAA